MDHRSQCVNFYCWTYIENLKRDITITKTSQCSHLADTVFTIHVYFTTHGWPFGIYNHPQRWSFKRGYRPVAQIPKSTSPICHNTPLLNRSGHFSVPKWYIVGHGTVALWDLWDCSVIYPYWPFLRYSRFQLRSLRCGRLAFPGRAAALAGEWWYRCYHPCR